MRNTKNKNSKNKKPARRAKKSPAHEKTAGDQPVNARNNRPQRGKSSNPSSGQGRPPQRREREEVTRIVGVLRRDGAQGWRIESTNRRERGEYVLHAKTASALVDGQLAIAEKIKSRHRFGREARLVEVIGEMDAVNAVSLIAIAQNEIPTAFSREAVAQANAARPVTLTVPPAQGYGAASRTDLRDIPLVTIDGPDSRDFDDAVFAEPWDEQGAVAPASAGEQKINSNSQQNGHTAEQSRPNKNGWHLIVAIADVAHYVTPGSALDKDAYERGNSAYFPDRVVPMLPEALSNDLCSLNPQVERACMAVHLWIDKLGELSRWQFVRGVMKSKARLTYEQVQAAIDGKADALTAPLLDPVLKPLYGAYDLLQQARAGRGTLELDLPERKVEIKNGKVASIHIRERLDSHRLIEEFMILANVAAATQLEQKKTPGLYRVHDRPSEMKLDALRDFLDSIGISLVPPTQLHPRFLTQILTNSANGPHAQVVNEIMLRSQSQAEYSPENIGHFGLALAKYAHFTSPIRRYADLVVHRGLIRACGLGEDGLTDRDIENLTEIGEHISGTERRAAGAEREATDRFITLFMADRVGETFQARISGVTRFGLFARIDETGADGLIPMNSLPDDYYIHDEKRQAMVGKRSGRSFQLAQQVMVKIAQADRLTGSLALTIVDDDAKAASPRLRPSHPAGRRRRK